MIQKMVSVVIVTRNRRQDLMQCVESYLDSSYKDIEIVVVDNASKPPLITWFSKKYPKVKLVTLDQNTGAAQGRNIGLDNCEGDYILFTDDDAYADRDMVKHLVWVFAHKKKAGIVQPLVYDKQKKNMLQGAGHDINLTTGRISASGVMEADRGQYDGIREVGMCGCVWMVKKEVFKRVGNYDEDYFIPYEDSDFSIRARNAGYKLYCYSKAKTWHQGPKKTFVHPRIEWLGITSPERAYRVARNKMIFMRKHSPFPQNLFFFFVMQPLYFIAHSAIILSSGRLDVFSRYLLGFASGIFYSLAYPFMGVRKIYNKLDKKIFPSKMVALAWTDPIPMVMNKGAKTILDLGCGDGKLMLMIKKRIKIEHAVGVDIFKPDLELAKKRKTHEEYILKDLRKIDFAKRSFDVVLASHVVEHLPKKEALYLIKKMERIAKKQVVIASPIGEMYHPAVGGNVHQIHLSAFTPQEFHRMGYKTVNYGISWLLGEEGLVHNVRSDFARKILYTLNILITPLYYLIPSISDYVFVAYKNLDK